MNTRIIVLFLFILIINPIFAEEYSLGVSAMKVRYASIDFKLETPIIVSNYNEQDEFTFRTAIFSNYKTQNVEVSAYYLDDLENKIYAEIITENENRYAIFKVKPITRREYIFYIEGSIVSENKLLLNNEYYSLSNKIIEEQEYQKATRFIQSDSLEIKAVAKFLKKTDDALENLVNVINWVHDYVEYDSAYIEEVNDAKKVLNDRKGVCDEISILAAAILRAQGYPVKYIAGYANTGKEWGPHAWLEVFIPTQGWIPVDPTYNEIGLVDSTHIVLEKLKDPVESKDSVNAIANIDIHFGEKKFNFVHKEIKSYEDMGYGNQINLSVIFNKDNLSESPFFTKLNLQNTTQNPIIILVTSQIAESFSQIYPKSRKKTYYLKPFENKTVNYFFILPKVDASYIFGFGFSSQFNDLEDTLNIHNRGIYQELFIAHEPSIYFKDNLFYFEQEFFNYTNTDKNIVFDFDYNSTKFSDTKTIPKKTEAKYLRNFQIIENADFSYVISGDYGLSGNTTLPKEQDFLDIIPIKEETDDFNSPSLPIQELKQKHNKENIKLDFLMVVLVIGFLLFIFILFISKSLKKQNIQ